MSFSMEKTNYNLKMKGAISSLSGEKPKLLLHACCAPCSSSVLERLTEYFRVTAFFFNPNITESEEYFMRLGELKRYISEVYGDEVNVAEGRYRSAEFFEMAKGLEREPEGGKRCEKCFELRLDETAKYAKENGYEWFCTTLTVSPHKNSQLLNEIGEKAGEKYGVKFLPSDFKKEGGFLRSTELSEEHGLYRQNYCGCIYSKNERLKAE